MEFLVSTASALLKVKLSEDHSLENVTVLAKDVGIHFGITRDVSNFYVLTRLYKPLQGEDGFGPHAILVYDRKFNLLSHIALPDKKIQEGHQMVLAGGLFHICNTSYNTLTLVSHEGKIVEDFAPVPRYTGQNYNHLNSVFIDQDSILLGFNNRFRASFILEYSRSPREFRSIDALGCGAHNTIRTPSLHVICDSRNGALLAWRSLRDEKGAELPVYRIILLPGAKDLDSVPISMARFGNYQSAPATLNFTRGLTLDEGGTLVCGLEPLSQRDERHLAPTRIAVIPNFEQCLGGTQKPKPTFHTLGFHGDVHDIRLTDRFDFGHPVIDK